MSEGPQALALAQIDRRFASLRLAAPAALRRLRASIEREGMRHPVVVSSAVEEKCWVLLDGFKRVRVATELALAQVWAQVLALNATQAKAAILRCNQASPGLSDVEEAWIVRALCREHGLTQVAIGRLLGRDKSWVCRRLKLAEALDEAVQDDLRLGLLSTTSARELARLPRGNQVPAAQAVRDHGLSTRQSGRLVQLLERSADPQARREVLADPLRYLAPALPTPPGSDPRLSAAGNRLRRQLLVFEGVCGDLTRGLHQHTPAPDETRVLTPLVLRAREAGRQATAQLAGIGGDG